MFVDQSLVAELFEGHRPVAEPFVGQSFVAEPFERQSCVELPFEGQLFVMGGIGAMPGRLVSAGLGGGSVGGGLIGRLFRLFGMMVTCDGGSASAAKLGRPARMSKAARGRTHFVMDAIGLGKVLAGKLSCGVSGQ